MFESDKDILRSLAKAEWCRLREFGVSNKELLFQDEFEGHFGRFFSKSTENIGKSMLRNKLRIHISAFAPLYPQIYKSYNGKFRFYQHSFSIRKSVLKLYTAFCCIYWYYNNAKSY